MREFKSQTTFGVLFTCVKKKRNVCVCVCALGTEMSHLHHSGDPRKVKVPQFQLTTTNLVAAVLLLLFQKDKRKKFQLSSKFFEKGIQNLRNLFFCFFFFFRGSGERRRRDSFSIYRLTANRLFFVTFPSRLTMLTPQKKKKKKTEKKFFTYVQSMTMCR